MIERLVDGRYVYQAPGRWMDIATGETIEGESIDFRPPRVQAAGNAVADADLREVVDRILRAADTRDAIGICTMHLPIGVLAARAVIDAAAAALAHAGFVSVRAIVALPEAIRRALAHRHVALFACEGEWGTETSRELTSWIRELAAGSPRSHLVVLLQGRRPETPLRIASVACERSSFDAPSPDRSMTGRFEIHAKRAVAFARRGRYASAARWSRAATECLRRGGDDAGVVRVAEHLVQQFVAAGAWEEARSAALRAFEKAQAGPLRGALAGLAARTLMWSGDLARADALLQGVVAELTAQGYEPGPAVIARRTEVLFWQGRFEAAACALAGVQSAEPDVYLWRTLSRWALEAGELPAADAAAIAPAALGSCLEIERLLASGRVEAARGVLGRGAARRRPPLEAALRVWLTNRCTEGADRPPPALTRFIQRTGARGILRWGLGRTSMNLLHGLPALLQIVQDADDEYCALRRGCGWVREHWQADAGIVATEGLALIAGEGLAAADLHDPDLRQVLAVARPRMLAAGQRMIVSAPMRYAGSTIGLALVRGRPDAGDTLTAAATALASACAPALRARLDHLALTAASQSRVPEILGRSPAVAALRDATTRAAATGFPVLIEGESGTGKELVARAVHRLSARRDRRFAALNCAALTDDLVEAELFGYTRGAFTGAVNHRAGLFEESHGSTLFLDEVAELSPRAQAKLLRVLQEREVRRVGDHLSRPIDVRVVAATNLPLAQAVGAGKFREDLLFRMAVVRIRVPPLRDRVEDIPLLAQAFWRSLTSDTDKRALLGPDAVAALCRHRWPGNVRELQNVIAGLVVAAPTRGRVGVRHVAQVLTGSTPEGESTLVTLEAARHALERRMLMAALSRHDGRCGSAARELGLSRQGLAKAMKRLGLEGRRQQVARDTPPGAASA